MKTDLAAAADAAFQEFDAKLSAVMEELERYRALIHDFEAIGRLCSLARQAGTSAVMESAMALSDIREMDKGGVLDLMRPNHPRAVKAPRVLQ